MKQGEIEFTRLSAETLRVTRVSPLSHEENMMDLAITEIQWARFIAGELIQKALPDLSNAEREFVLTGYTQEDWDKMFPPGMED